MESINTSSFRVRRGDSACLAAAFHEHRVRLRRVVATRLSSRMTGRVDADDVLQEAFVQAVRRSAHLRGDSPEGLYVWLRLIVLQTLADVRRRHLGTQKRDASRERMDGARVRNVRRGSPVESVERIEMAARIRAAMGNLRSDDQQVLALRHFSQLANHEVASALGIKPKAASIRYARALGRLKTIFGRVDPLDLH